MTDLLPPALLPAGNIMVGAAFSIGSISGPFLGGIYVQVFSELSFFYLIVAVLFIIMAATFFKRETRGRRLAE